MQASGIRTKTAGMMPEPLADLERLVAVPSVALPGHPPERETEASMLVLGPEVLPRDDAGHPQLAHGSADTGRADSRSG